MQLCSRAVAVALHQSRAHAWLSVRLGRSASEFRVEKSRARSDADAVERHVVHGCFFISGDSRTHAGPEGVRDVLNGESGFFPFEAGRLGRCADDSLQPRPSRPGRAAETKASRAAIPATTSRSKKSSRC